MQVIGKLKSILQDKGQDYLGRWVYMKFLRSDKSVVTLICTYQVVDVNPQAPSTGPTTYATQLHSQYTGQGRLNPHDLRKHHSDDLVKFVKDCQTRGELIVVAGDLNEVMGDETDGLTRLCSQCDLVDAVLDKHQATNFKTYERGQKVLDYILVDPVLLPSIQACGYEPFKVRIISDHRGVYIDVNTNMMFGDRINNLLPMELRDINSKKAFQISPYFDHKNQHLHDHNWFAKVEKVQACIDRNRPNNRLANDCYNRLVSASNYGGSKLKKFPPAPYSPELARLRNIKALLQVAVSSFTSQYDHRDNLASLQAKLGGLGFEIPSTTFPR